MFQIIGKRKDKFQHRSYHTPGDRSRAIALLRKQGFNYFVCYREGCIGARNSNQIMAIQFTTAEWVMPGQVYIDR